MVKTKDSRSKDICSMQGCNREVLRIQAGLCGRCYSWLYYNRDKTAAELRERRETLTFWEERLDGFLASKPRGKKLEVVR